jgi:hypothetical protein
MAKATKAALLLSKIIGRFKWALLIFAVLYFTSKAADGIDHAKNQTDYIHSIIAPVGPASDLMIELISKVRYFRN